ncbi:hypothetical protein KI440_01850 [Candidatus Saccharibacteria bacterium TM7i]|nr:hypothetical protein KI440_01850 [Candidatus Saccharibacteria bacterium TM7i]
MGHAERLEIINGRPLVVDKLPAPIDEHGIPRVEIMMPQLLGQMATRYVWTGRFDLHHMATPKADYNIVPDNVGKAFRSLSALKLEIPRQMHNFAHELFLNPRRPPADAVMRQAILENEQMRTLNAIMSDEPDSDKAQMLVWDALMDMVDPRVDIMPSREELADMEFYDLRRTVASLISVRRYADKTLIHPAIRPREARRHSIV